MITELRLDGSVRVKSVKRSGEACIKERKWYKSQSRGDRTIASPEARN